MMSSGLLAAISIALLLIGLWGIGARELLQAATAGGFAGVLPPFASLTMDTALLHAANLLKALLSAAAITGTGVSILRAAGLRAHNRFEESALGFALGTVAWAAVFFILGIAQLLDARLLLPFGLMAGLHGLWTLLRPSQAVAPIRIPASDRSEAGVFALLLLAQLVVLLPHALIPETFYDALEYHLGLPHLYLLQGGIRANPDNAFAGVPSMPSMLYGWALLLDRWGIVAHLLNFSALVGVSAALIGLAARLGAPAAGVMGAALLASFPIAAAAAFLTTVELWWTLYLFSGLTALLAALDADPSTPARKRWLAACGLMLGAAMATKYIAWAAPAGIITVYMMLRREPGVRIGRREMLVAAGFAACILAPWVMKNILHYGNPIYPFFHDRIAPTAEISPGWKYLGVGTTLPLDRGVLPYLHELLLSPWRAAFYQANIAQSFGPAILSILTLLIFARPRGATRVAYWYAVGCGLPFLFIVQLPRYLLPCAALITGVAAICLWQHCDPSRRRWANAGLAITTAIILIITWGIVLPRAHRETFSGRKSFSEFLSHGNTKLYSPPAFPAADFLDHHTPPDAKVLIFGDARGFHIPREHALSTPGHATALERLSNASTSADDIRARLSKDRIGYILVNYAEIIRSAQPLRFTASGKRNLDEFWARHTEKVFQAGPNTIASENGRPFIEHWVAVYKIGSPSESRTTRTTDDLITNIVMGPRANPR